MSPLLILPYYIEWHYGRALVQGVGIIENIVWFFWHFYSIKDLSRTIFSPWQRIHEERQHGGGIEDILTVWLINILMIMAGALIRLFMILLGFAFILVTIALGIISMLVWITLPAGIIVSFILGIVFLIKPA
jgi:hypothetical protein